MKDCESCKASRREILGVTAGGAASLALSGPLGFIERLLTREGRAPGKARACILLWMSGGPSQLDTWDPKPGTETGGEFKAAETAVKGIRISEHLPKLAREMKRFSILRTVSSPEGDHDRASFFLHTGYRPREAASYPSAGSMFSHELSERPDFPHFVSIGSGSYGPAFLGHEHAPFTVGEPASALERIKLVGEGRGRIGLMNRLGRAYSESHASEAQARREAAIQGLPRLKETPFAGAFDLSGEPDKLKEDYGTNPFGVGCLLARRLVERGVRFVEVELGGWDTHSDNFNTVRENCATLDPAFATLLKDLSARGLLDETVVLWLGEFGRTPAINSNNGRDHFPDITAAALAGGPIQGGRVVGETNATGTEIVRGRVRVADLFATLYEACGIDPAKKFHNREGAVFKATDAGAPIRELLS